MTMLPCRFAAIFASLMCVEISNAQLLGDLDGDGSPGIADIARLNALLTDSSGFTEQQITLADADQDGALSQLDADVIKEAILKKTALPPVPASQVRLSLPGDGDSEISTEAHVDLFFNVPLAVGTVLDSSVFRAAFGGEALAGSVSLTPDRKKASLYFSESLPSNARITVSFTGDGLTDVFGRAVDGDADGMAGGTHQFSFDTLSIIPLSNTGVVGQVFDADQDGGNDVPIAGVTITVVGSDPVVSTTTDATGSFTLTPCPAGSFFVEIDGRTSPASSFPSGDYYPFIGKVWDAQAGRTDNPAGGTGIVYLPCICEGSLQAVSQVTDTSISFPQEVIDEAPELAGVFVSVPANSLQNSNGTPGAMVGIAPVPPDRLPAPLPDGLDLGLVITVQTDGATIFQEPAPVCFPNTPDPNTGEPLPPGAKSALWSFDHSTGEWSIVGPMTVTADGLFVKSDPGVGIRAPGWHGSQPGSQGRGGTGAMNCGNLSRQQFNQMRDVLDKGVSAGWSATTTASSIMSEIGDRFGASSRILKFIGVTSFIKNWIDCLGFTDPDIDTLSDEEFNSFFRGKARACLGAIVETTGLMTGGTFVLNAIKTALNVDGLFAFKESVDSLRDAMNKAPPSVADCLNARPDFTPARRASTNQRIQAAASKAEQSAIRANTELDAQVPAYTAVADDVEVVKPLLEQVDGNHPQGNLTREQWKTVRDRSIGIVDRLGPLRNRPTLSDILNDLINDYDDFCREVIPPLVSRPPSSAPPLVGGFGPPLIALPPPPPLPGPSFCLLETGTNQRRFTSDQSGAVSLILSPNLGYRLRCYEPSNNRYGQVFFRAPRNGRNNILPTVPLSEDNGIDTDGDGLSDQAEEVIGTFPNDPDSDDDGINDRAEVEQGLDPLEGTPAVTGVIAQAPTTGSAEDICAVNDLVITANGRDGITVFNVFSGTSPVRVVQFNTPGSAVAVTCSGDLIGIADYSAGLQILDISDTADPRIVRQVNLGQNAVAVTSNGPIAYVGTDRGSVFCVDMNTGSILNGVSVGAGAIEDLTVVGGNLYVLQVGRLSTIPLDTTSFSVADSVTSPGIRGRRRFRLSAGDGVLYATWRQGYNIFDIATDPQAPAHLTQHATGQLGWKQIVTNGSGLGIAVTAANTTNDGPHHLDLYDLGSNGQGTTFLETIPTPGLAAAVSLYNGLAYVADSSAGLTVVNYRAIDTAGNAPGITLDSNADLASGNVEEAALLRLTADVTDDVQVRNVAFYVDDELQLTDGNFPFEHRFIVPTLAEASTIKVRALATDTGGNSTWSTEFTLTLTPDARPPEVVAFVPNDSSFLSAVNEVSVIFNEAMDLDTLVNGGFTLEDAGDDGLFDTTDDIDITGGLVGFRTEVNAVFRGFADSLEPGQYRISVQSPAADLAGNVLVSAQSSEFQIFSSEDGDNDGIADDWETRLGLIPGVLDSDDNGTRDGDEDFDGDGIPNGLELILGLDPSKADTDGDGTNDGAEDFDFDGLTNAQEVVLNTSLTNVDSDGDFLDDFTENATGSDPNDSNSGTSNTIASGKLAFANFIPEAAPSNLVGVAMSSKPVTIVNALSSQLPTNLTGVAASSDTVLFQNTLSATPPATLSISASSEGVTYKNETP